MANRGKATFQKRQKEMARKDKQQRKAARRAERKGDGANAGRRLPQDIESRIKVGPQGEASEI